MKGEYVCIYNTCPYNPVTTANERVLHEHPIQWWAVSKALIFSVIDPTERTMSVIELWFIPGGGVRITREKQISSFVLHCIRKA